MSKKSDEIMEYLHLNVFDPIHSSPTASSELKKGVNYTIMRMNNLDERGMLKYYWSAVSGTDRSIGFARRMEEEGFVRFEDLTKEFGEKFDDKWLLTK